MKVVQKVQNWYGRYERPISSLSLIAGFVFDAVTLDRVDQFWENLWLLGHIFIVAACMVLLNARQGRKDDEKNPNTLYFWLVNILQFFFGGLLSTLLVFYFRSATLSVSWPFIFILVLAFVANERFKRHFVRLTFQISLLFLSLFLCAIFLVPVVTHSIGSSIFLLSGLVSLVAIFIFIRIIARTSRKKFDQSKRFIFMSVFGIFALVNLLYFTGLIPPIPLSLKDAGMYHSVYRVEDGSYIGMKEETGWFRYFERYENIHIRLDDPVHAYTAIFSPTNINTTIIHKWQKLDPVKNKWVTEGTVSLSVLGGRDGGFRTYSTQVGLAEGKWRVSVETTEGHVLGRLLFNIILSGTEPKLVPEVNE